MGNDQSLPLRIMLSNEGEYKISLFGDLNPLHIHIKPMSLGRNGYPKQDQSC